MELSSFFTVVGLVLTIVAFLLAILQIWQASNQSRSLRKHRDSLAAIASALSTRYIGSFPEYLPSVTKIIQGAQSDLLIVNDNPTPAYFSAPMYWIEYRHAVATRMHSGVDVTLISMNDRQRLRRMQDQFAMDPSEWPQWCKANEHLLKTFLSQQYPDELGSLIEYPRFLDMLVATQAKLSSELFGPATRVEIDSPVTLQVWIVDKKEAVFSIETTAENSLSHGLYTSDPKFVSALYSMAELYRSPWTASNV